jgi:hypothetical protein
MAGFLVAGYFTKQERYFNQKTRCIDTNEQIRFVNIPAKAIFAYTKNTKYTTVNFTICRMYLKP